MRVCERREREGEGTGVSMPLRLSDGAKRALLPMLTTTGPAVGMGELVKERQP